MNQTIQGQQAKKKLSTFGPQTVTLNFHWAQLFDEVTPTIESSWEILVTTTSICQAFNWIWWLMLQKRPNRKKWPFSFVITTLINCTPKRSTVTTEKKALIRAPWQWCLSNGLFQLVCSSEMSSRKNCEKCYLFLDSALQQPSILIKLGLSN